MFLCDVGRDRTRDHRCRTVFREVGSKRIQASLYEREAHTFHPPATVLQTQLTYGRMNDLLLPRNEEGKKIQAWFMGGLTCYMSSSKKCAQVAL